MGDTYYNFDTKLSIHWYVYIYNKKTWMSGKVYVKYIYIIKLGKKL